MQLLTVDLLPRGLTSTLPPTAPTPTISALAVRSYAMPVMWAVLSTHAYPRVHGLGLSPARVCLKTMDFHALVNYDSNDEDMGHIFLGFFLIIPLNE
jgi:hypothetical protein